MAIKTAATIEGELKNIERIRKKGTVTRLDYTFLCGAEQALEWALSPTLRDAERPSEAVHIISAPKTYEEDKEIREG